jgi:hypothetical protein
MPTGERGIGVLKPQSAVFSHYNTKQEHRTVMYNMGHFIMFSVITNIYNKKTKGPTLRGLFTATGKLKKVFFDN